MNLQGDYSRNYFSRKRHLDELLQLKDDDSGYVEGKVFMIWPPRNRLHRINLEVAEDCTLYRFEVEVPHKDGITFRPHERVCFALKGMRADRRKESSAPHCFPIILRFPDGVVFKYLSGTNAGKVVDTWEGKRIHCGSDSLMSVLECTGNTGEWYDPGMVRTVSDAVTVDASEIRHGPILTVTHSPIPTIPRTDSDVASCDRQDVRVNSPSPSLIPIADGAAVAQQPSTERPGRSSRGRARKKRRLLKEKESTLLNHPANDADKPLPTEVTTSCHELPQTSIHTSLTNVSGGHPRPHQGTERAPGETSVRENNGINIPREDDHNDTVTVPEEPDILALQLKAGIRTQRVGYLIIALLGVNIACQILGRRFHCHQ